MTGPLKEAVGRFVVVKRPGWRVPVVVLGIVAEVVVLVPFLLFDEPGLFVGSLGALPVAIACLAGLLAGPVAAALVGLAGWGFFFVAIAAGSLLGFLALPLWVGPALLVGFLANRLRHREHDLAIFEAERRYDGLRRDLANQAHHEVRTPATVIFGMAEMLLRDDLELTEDQNRRFLELIAESAQRLSEIPDRLEHHEATPVSPPVHGGAVSAHPRRSGAKRTGLPVLSLRDG